MSRLKNGKFQSTPPAWGATFPAGVTDVDAGISIHAPREGGDASFFSFMFTLLFQSTPPARGATRWVSQQHC